MQIRLDYLIAVAEEQNITRAARRLYISQPALTKYINQVEEYFGVRIFDRTKSPVTLTEAGNMLLREQSRIETAQMNLRRKLEMLKDNRLRLTIGTGYGRGGSWIPEVLHIFCQAHPEIDVRVHCCGELSLLDRLRSGRIDLGVGVCDFTGEGVISRVLQTEPLRLAIPLSFGLFPEDFDAVDSFEHPYLLTPEALNDLDYIAPTEDMGSYASYQTLLYQQGIRFRRQIVSNSSSAIRAMVKAGLGYAYCSTGKNIGSWLEKDGTLRVGCATIPGLSLQRTCSLGYLSDHANREFLREIADITQDVVKEFV